MQTIYAIVQLRSNMQLKNESLHYNNDLEAKWVQVMNTKVVPYDNLSMFKALLRSHKYFIDWLHVNPIICKAFSDNTCDISKHRDRN